MTPLWQHLVRYLETNGYVGRKHPVTQDVAAAEIGCNTRELQEAMGDVPDKFLVASACTAPMGIYLCETAEDAEQYERQLDSRVRHQAGTLRRVRAWLRHRAETEARAQRPPEENSGQLLFSVPRTTMTAFNH